MRDRFHLFGSPKLVGTAKNRLSASQILAYPLIEAGWPSDDP